ncbi:type 1 periplasmic-binding domain-containing protein [Flindersiella endophytica]
MVDRRFFLLGGTAIGAAAVVSACTSNDPAAVQNEDKGKTTQPAAAGTDNDKPGKKVTMGFLAPAADHGWIAAIAQNANETAKGYSDIDWQAVEPTSDIAQQIAAVESFISNKVDIIVVLPQDGAQLNSVARKAMDAGIPVVNLDRIFPEKLSYRTWIGGDNYGMGVSAGHYIGKKLKAGNVSNPVIAEIAGMDELPLTQERSKGFKDALATYGFKVTARQAARFTVETGEAVTRNVLQAESKIDAMWNHDDDQGIGVLAAIKQASRDDFFMVGGAGSANAMREIKAGTGVLEATVTYSPTMAASAIKLGRLIAQGKGMSDLVEKQVPASITLASETITKDNVDQYMSLGFES